MEVFFCDRCSIRLTESDFEEGRAFHVKDFCFCKKCWDDSEVRSAIEKVTGRHAAVDPAPEAPSTGVTGRATPPRGGRRAKTPGRAGVGQELRLRKSPTRGRTPPGIRSPHRRRTPPRGSTPPRGVRRSPVGTPAVRRSPAHTTRRTRPERGGSGSSNTMLLVIVCAAGGLVLGLIAMILLSSGDGSSGRRRGGPPTRKRERPGAEVTGAHVTGRAVWLDEIAVGVDVVEYSGRLDVDVHATEVRGSVSAKFPAAGSWTVDFTDAKPGLAFIGAAAAGERKVLGRASTWLRPGRNRVKATFQGTGAAGAPVIEVVPGEGDEGSGEGVPAGPTGGDAR